MFERSIIFRKVKKKSAVIIICQIQNFEADLWKVSLKILNSGIILTTFTHGALWVQEPNYIVLIGSWVIV